MRRALPWLSLGLGVLVLAAGVAVFWTANALPRGWTAYAPLEPGESPAYTSTLAISFDGGSVLWTGRHLLGAGLGVLGLLILVGTAGWLLGRRAGRATRPAR